MVIRIEPLLIFVTFLLIFSIVGINPTSKPAVNAKGDKEISFKNFELIELKEEESGRNLIASKATKYQNYLDLKEINISDNGHNITAKRAIYEDDSIFMQDEVLFKRSDGLTFSTQEMNYDLKNEELKTFNTFELAFNNGSTLMGTKLYYNLKEKTISADNIEAKIFID